MKALNVIQISVVFIWMKWIMASRGLRWVFVVNFYKFPVLSYLEIQIYLAPEMNILCKTLISGQNEMSFPFTVVPEKENETS